MKYTPAPLLKAASAISIVVLLVTGCTTHSDPPAESYIKNAEIRDVVARVAKHHIHPLVDGDYKAVASIDEAKAAKQPEGITWNYPWGVALYGMMRSTDVTGDKDAAKFVQEHDQICARYYQWLAGLEKQFGTEGEDFARTTKIKGLVTLGNLDSCGAMGNQFLEMVARNPGNVTQADQDVVARIADWILEKQLRLPDGTLARPPRPDLNGVSVWPDDLYMACPFIVRWSQYTGNAKLLDDAANQIIHQAELEQDADGLFFHGYNATEKKHSAIKWGRGNGWVTVATVEVLSALPKDHPSRAKLIAILKKQVDGLKAMQAPDGMWRQVLDHPELWEETSCTAMFTYGIARAVNRGWLAPSYMDMARKAFAGLTKNVTPEGVINETCEGTSIRQSLDYYVNRKRLSDDPHGWGPVMLAGTEILPAK